jgi:hypothetical protein
MVLEYHPAESGRQKVPNYAQTKLEGQMDKKILKGRLSPTWFDFFSNNSLPMQ